MPKRTYQPKTKKRLRTHGFLARVCGKYTGLKVIKRRRAKQRQNLSKSVNKRYK